MRSHKFIKISVKTIRYFTVLFEKIKSSINNSAFFRPKQKTDLKII